VEIIDVNSILGLLYHVAVGNVAGVVGDSRYLRNVSKIAHNVWHTNPRTELTPRKEVWEDSETMEGFFVLYLYQVKLYLILERVRIRIVVLSLFIISVSAAASVKQRTNN
jgi:hypothetical protein